MDLRRMTLLNHPPQLLPNARAVGLESMRQFVLGVDGGGSKTRAVILSGDGAKILGEGVAGASNPLRVGFQISFEAIKTAVDEACHAAGIERTEIAAAVFGLAGVRRPDVRARVRADLKRLGIKPFHVITDADAALYGASDGAAGIVVIAGTGSICCGMNKEGRRASTGGWGPMVGDEGSGAWIAQRALRAVSQASDKRRAATSLVAAALEHFGVKSVDDLIIEINLPTNTTARIAGFARVVIEAARAGDRVAREILSDAARELASLVTTTIRQLEMQHESFRVAYVGGVFEAGELILAPLRQAIKTIAPHATLAPPALAPAVAAARMARAQLKGAPRFALAG